MARGTRMPLWQQIQSTNRIRPQSIYMANRVSMLVYLLGYLVHLNATTRTQAWSRLTPLFILIPLQSVAVSCGAILWLVEGKVLYNLLRC